MAGFQQVPGFPNSIGNQNVISQPVVGPSTTETPSAPQPQLFQPAVTAGGTNFPVTATEPAITVSDTADASFTPGPSNGPVIRCTAKGSDAGGVATLPMTGWTNAARGQSGTVPVAGDRVFVLISSVGTPSTITQTGDASTWSSRGPNVNGTAFSSVIEVRDWDGTETGPVFNFGTARISWLAIAVAPQAGYVLASTIWATNDIQTTPAFNVPFNSLTTTTNATDLILAFAGMQANGNGAFTVSATPSTGYAFAPCSGSNGITVGNNQGTASTSTGSTSIEYREGRTGVISPAGEPVSYSAGAVAAYTNGYVAAVEQTLVAQLTATEPAIGVSDTATRLVSLPRSISEPAIAVSDAATRSAQAFTRAASEPSTSVSDVATRTAAHPRAISETAISVSDVATRTTTNPRAISEAAISVSDSTSRTATHPRSVSEPAITSSDSAVRGTQAFSRTATETIVFSDSASRTISLVTRTASEPAISASDAATRTAAHPRSISEPAITTSDSATRALQAFVRTVAETITVSDSASRSISLVTRTASESIGSVTDVATRTLSFTRTASEPAITASDSSSRTAAHPRAISEAAITVSDSVSRSISLVIRTATEAVGAVTDTAARTAAHPRVQNDTVVGNMVRDPSFEHDVLGAGPSGGWVVQFNFCPTVTNQIQNTWSQVGSQSWRLTSGASTSASGYIWATTSVGAAGLGVVGGASYYVQAAVNLYAGHPSGRVLQTRVYWYDSAGTFISQSTPQSVTTAAGTTYVLAGLVTAPSNAVTALVGVYAALSTVGDTGDLAIDAVQMTPSSVAVAYGDGDTSGWSWIGTPGNGTSVYPQAISVSDVAAGQVQFGRTATDAIGAVTDVISRTAAHPRAISEPAISISDAATKATSVTRTATEAIGAVTDVATRTRNLPRGIAEPAVSVSDSTIRGVQAFTRSATETISASDSATRTQAFTRTASETAVSVTDAAVGIIPLSRTATEPSLTFSDSATRTAAHPRTVSEPSVGVSDTTARAAAHTRSISEPALTFSDTAKGPVARPRTATEPSIAVSDSTLRSAHLIRSVAEPSISVADVLNRNTTHPRTLAEPAIAVSDSSQPRMGLTRTATEPAITVSDQIRVTTTRDIDLPLWFGIKPQPTTFTLQPGVTGVIASPQQSFNLQKVSQGTLSIKSVPATITLSDPGLTLEIDDVNPDHAIDGDQD